MMRIAIPTTLTLLVLSGVAGAQEGAAAPDAEAKRLRAGVRILYAQEYALKWHDLETGSTKTLVEKLSTEMQPFRLCPSDPSRLLTKELERLLLVNLQEGSATVLVQKPRIDHPGCGHIESALESYRWLDGGTRVLFGYRQVPKGTDPHQDAPSQHRKAWISSDGGEVNEDGLQSRSWPGLPNVDVTGTRAIVTRTHNVEKGVNAVEVVLKELKSGDETSIVTLTIKSLEGVIARWAPDGSRILIVHRRRGPGRAQHIGLHVWDGEDCRLLDDSAGRMGLGGTGGYTTQWSPDSRKIAFIRIESPGITPQAIEVWDLVERKRVAAWADPCPTGATPCAPHWFADSRRLAWVAYTCPGKGYHQHRFAGCTTELRVADCAAPDDAPTVVGTDGITYRMPQATPDGRHLLYFREIARTTKGKGDFWDDVTSRTVELAAIELSTGKLRTISHSPEFAKIEAARFYFPKK